ncbi:MAG: GNAT family N-acetyltransferase [Sandaracinaceae bacterium]|jgi:putative acetyltransferase|nr:GNAT family N-acetyltransferase [Sandaracinaceae bacterium]
MPNAQTPKKKPANLVIRATEPADTEALSRFFSQPSVHRGTLRTPYESVSTLQKCFVLDDPLQRSLVAEIRGVIVGEVSVTARSRERIRHTATLGMMVHEKYQGRGVGGALLDAAVDYAENWAGILRIELEVFVDNVAAIALYRSRGFNIEGIARAIALRDGVYVDAFRMARLAQVLPHPRLLAEDVTRTPPQLARNSSASASDLGAKKKPKGGAWGGGRGSA